MNDVDDRTMLVNFISVYQDDKDLCDSIEHFLYLLMSERDKIINISHTAMPTFANHVKFVKSKPYKHWYVLQQDKHPYGKMGAIYLTNNNEVGIFLLRQYQGKGYGTKALLRLLRLHRERPVYANINPLNLRSIDFFTSHGFKDAVNVYDNRGKIKQITYTFTG
jgi:RimJ/RimL family protein N-acetyltransferase